MNGVDDRPAPVSNRRRQPVLDAMVGLQTRRLAVIAALQAGRDVPGASVLAAGPDLGPWMMRESHGWRHLLSTRSVTTGAQLRESMPNNRVLLDHGLEMISVFDAEGTDGAARALLDADVSGVYRYGYAPVQMRIVDRRLVVLQGPDLPEGGSVVGLTDRTSLTAAHRYWRAVLDTATRCGAPAPPAALGIMTARQRSIMDLLRADFDDAAIAAALGVSVRTVRYDLAAVYEAFGVSTRFAAGYAYAQAVSASD